MKKIFLLGMIALLTFVFTGCDSKEKELKKLEREKRAEIERHFEATDRFLKDAAEASKNADRALQENLEEIEKAERSRRVNEILYRR